MVNGWVSQSQEDGVERHTLNNRMSFQKKSSTRVGKQITATRDTELMGEPTKQGKIEKLSLIKKHPQNIVIVVDSDFFTTPILFNPYFLFL